MVVQNISWNLEMPNAPGQYLWREQVGAHEHVVEIFYEQAPNGEVGRCLRCYSLTDFGAISGKGQWAYKGENMTPNCTRLDIERFAAAIADDWFLSFPQKTGAYLWRQRVGALMCRIDVTDATLMSGKCGRLVRSYAHGTSEEFAMLRTQGEWASPPSLNQYG